MVTNNLNSETQPVFNVLTRKSLKNLVIVSYSFEGLGVGLKALAEGLNSFVIRLEPTDVRAGLQKEIKEERRMILGNGLIEVVDKNDGLKRLQKLNPEETFIFYDFNWGFEYGKEIRKLGFKGLIPTQEDFEFEKDRDKAKKFVKKNYPLLKVAEEIEFNDVDKALEFLDTEEGKENIWVFKSHGDKVSTFVPPFDDLKIDNELLKEYLIDNRKDIEKSSFILERKILNAIEFVPQVWFDFDGNPIGASIDIELKHIGNFNTSYQTGCSADVLLHLPINSLAFEWFLEPIIPYVKERVGEGKPILIWDAGVLYEPNSGNYYFSEFASDRPGYNFLYTELATVGSVKEFFEKIMNGENPYGSSEDRFGASIRLFNLFEIEQKCYEQFIIPQPITSDVWLMDAYKEGKNIKTVGYDDNAIILTAVKNDPYLALIEVQEKALQPKWKLFYFRTDLSQNYPGSLFHRLDFLLSSDIILEKIV